MNNALSKEAANSPFPHQSVAWLCSSVPSKGIRAEGSRVCLGFPREPMVIVTKVTQAGLSSVETQLSKSQQ